MTTDSQLLRDYVERRDAEAFTELVRRHAGMVHATCLRICGHRSDAEDAAQESFIELARHCARITGSVPAWLHVVASRMAMRVLERRRETAQPIEVAAPEESVGERTALMAAVDAAMAELPDRERAVLVLRFLEARTQQ